jgi:adenine-specific DNA-methyltransferase
MFNTLINKDNILNTIMNKSTTTSIGSISATTVANDKMNTLNYIGSKHTLCSTLISVIKAVVPDLQSKTFMDLFAGTGSVGFQMQPLVSSCSANDLEYYSFVINNALLCCPYSEKLQEIINECNTLEGIEGLIYNAFSPHQMDSESVCERMFFSNENAKRCDAMRQYIELQKVSERLTMSEYHFMVASLLVVMDKVANTSCVYGAYLKAFKGSALKSVLLIPIHTRDTFAFAFNSESKDSSESEVYNMKAEDLCRSDKHFDVVYMDPPYNQRQYSANYSPLNYIALYDPAIVLTGKTGLIANYNRSDFCSKVKVKNAFKLLLDNIKCNYLFISYNNEGLLSCDELKEILETYGDLVLHKIPYKKFKAQQSVVEDSVFEYLWVLCPTMKK